MSNRAKSRIRRENRYTSLNDAWEAVSSDKFDQTGHWIGDVLSWKVERLKRFLPIRNYKK